MDRICIRYVFSDISAALPWDLTNECFPVWKGAVSIGNDGPVQDSFHTLVLSNKKGETGVQLTAAHDDTQFVVVCHHKCIRMLSFSFS